MLTRRTLLASVGAAALAVPALAVAATRVSPATVHDLALQTIARRVQEVLDSPESARLWSMLPGWGSDLSPRWRAAPNLEGMVGEQTNAIFTGNHAHWLKKEFGTILYEGRVNSWLNSNILNRFPLYSFDLEEPAIQAAFTALVPAHMR